MPGCGCGGSRTSQVTYLAGDGPLALGGFPDCTDGYTGAPKVVVVVDRLGPNERIYPGYEMGDAAVYANSHGVAALELVNAYRLCAAAVNDVPAA